MLIRAALATLIASVSVGGGCNDVGGSYNGTVFIDKFPIGTAVASNSSFNNRPNAAFFATSSFNKEDGGGGGVDSVDFSSDVTSGGVVNSSLNVTSLCDVILDVTSHLDEEFPSLVGTIESAIDSNIESNIALPSSDSPVSSISDLLSSSSNSTSSSVSESGVQSPPSISTQVNQLATVSSSSVSDGAMDGIRSNSTSNNSGKQQTSLLSSPAVTLIDFLSHDSLGIQINTYRMHGVHMELIDRVLNGSDYCRRMYFGQYPWWKPFRSLRSVCNVIFWYILRNIIFWYILREYYIGSLVGIFLVLILISWPLTFGKFKLLQ